MCVIESHIERSSAVRVTHGFASNPFWEGAGAAFGRLGRSRSLVQPQGRTATPMVEPSVYRRGASSDTLNINKAYAEKGIARGITDWPNHLDRNIDHSRDIGQALNVSESFFQTGETKVQDAALTALLSRQLGASPFSSHPPGSFADGGIALGPMQAMIGGNPSGREVVVPLEKANHCGFDAGLSDADADRIGKVIACYSNATINLSSPFDGRTLDQYIINLLTGEAQRTP